METILVDAEVYTFLTQRKDMTANQVLRYLLGIDKSPQDAALMRRAERPAGEMLPHARILVVDENYLDGEGRLDLTLAFKEQDRTESLHAIENDLDHGINLAQDVLQGGYRSKVTHPWDQGLRIFPKGTSWADLETAALAQAGRLCDAQSVKGRIHCIAPQGHPGPHIMEHYHDPQLPEGSMKEITIGEVVSDE